MSTALVKSEDLMSDHSNGSSEVEFVGELNDHQRNGTAFRYFSKQELRELFILEDTHSSNTQVLLQSLHAKHRRTDTKLDEHIMHLHSMEIFGISDHDLMFSKKVNDHEEPDDKKTLRDIERKVKEAQELMKAESEMNAQLGSSEEQVWLRQMGHNSHEGPWSSLGRLLPESNNNTRCAPAVEVKLEQAAVFKKKPTVRQPGKIQFPPRPQFPDYHNAGVALKQTGAGKKKRAERQRQSMQLIDLTLDEDVRAKQTVGMRRDLSEMQHYSPRDISFRSKPVEKENSKKKNQSMHVIDLTLEKSVNEYQAVNLDGRVTENQDVDLDEGVAENQAVDLDQGVPESQVGDLEEGVAENEVGDLKESVAENEAVDLDEGITEIQAVNKDDIKENQSTAADEGTKENQAIDTNEGIKESQAIDADDGIKEKRAIDAEEGVQEKQAINPDEVVTENEKKRKAAVLYESLEKEDDDHMPSASHFDRSSPSYYAVLKPLCSTPIRSSSWSLGEDTLEALRNSTRSFFETWTNEEYQGAENYSD